MKTKYLFNTALAAVFIMSATACNNELTDEQTSENRQPISITATLPANADTRLNYDDSDASKLALTWKNGDELIVYKDFGSQSYPFTLDESAAGTKNGTFTGGPVFDNNNKMLAIYPKGTYTGGVNGLQLPIANQSGVLADSPHHYMFASTIYKDGETPNFPFSHLMAVVKLQLDFSNVSVTGNIKNVSLSGTGIFDKAVLTNAGVLTAAVDANATVGTTSTAEFSLTDNKATVYLFLFPGTVSNAKITATDGTTKYEYALTDATLAAGSVYKVTATMQVATATYAVGDLYPNATNPIGKVFYVSDGGAHGKIVAMNQQASATWTAAQAFAKKTENGLSWDLPTLDELCYLWCAYNGVTPTTWAQDTWPSSSYNAEAQQTFNSGLSTAFISNYYWSCDNGSSNPSVNSRILSFKNDNKSGMAAEDEKDNPGDSYIARAVASF